MIYVDKYCPTKGMSYLSQLLAVVNNPYSTLRAALESCLLFPTILPPRYYYLHDMHPLEMSAKN